LPFEVSARYIVKQELEAGSEHASVTFAKVTKQRFAQQKQFVQTAVETVVIHIDRIDAQQIIKGSVCIPAFTQCQFRTLRTETAHAEDAVYCSPFKERINKV